MYTQKTVHPIQDLFFYFFFEPKIPQAGKDNRIVAQLDLLDPLGWGTRTAGSSTTCVVAPSLTSLLNKNNNNKTKTREEVLLLVVHKDGRTFVGGEGVECGESYS